MPTSKPTAVYYEVQDLQPGTVALLRERFEAVSFPDPDQAAPEALAKARAVFAPMGFVFDAARFDLSPQLAVIGTPTTGEMHIDAEEAARRSVRICSLRDQQEFLASITPTAELAWGLALALTRSMLPAMDSVLQGSWEPKTFGGRSPRMLSRMRLGVLGLGRLGRLVARYGKAFGMEVGYFDPYVEDPEYTRHASPLELAAASDIVSLHVHATPETTGLVDRKFIRAMPKGSYLVNTARGDIVDEEALLDGLASNHLAGAALDMVTGDHLPGFADRRDTHPLYRYAREHDNLIITPKYGGSTKDSWESTETRIVDMMAEECRQRGLM